MINPNQLARYILQPVLEQLGESGGNGWDSMTAVQLLMETAMQESRLCHLDQLDYADQPGPAYGIYQVEEATYKDLFWNYLDAKPPLRRIVVGFSFQRTGAREIPHVTELRGNLYYATAVARCLYRRVPSALPTSRSGRAGYWKRYWNTYLGKGTTEQYLENALRLYRVWDS